MSLCKRGHDKDIVCRGYFCTIPLTYLARISYKQS